MKAVLMSIKHKWCEKIFSGEKTIEVRKTAPKETPFKVYVYCTKARHKPNDWLYHLPNDRTLYFGANARDVSFVREEGDFRNGMVIGEFVCYEKEYFTVGSLRCDEIEELACLSHQEMIEYFYKPEELDGKTVKAGTALHITAPKRYDTPKELGEFWTVRCTNKTGECKTCEVKPACIKNVTRPPQSWMYVEEIEE